MYIDSTVSLTLHAMLYLANQSNPTEDKQGKCYGVYGCFEINGVWESPHRQINVYPQEVVELQPTFTLYTTKDMDKPVEIDINDPDKVLKMGINARGKIFFISHGFLETGKIQWMKDMGKALLNAEPKDEAAVVLVDWGLGSNPPYYQAASNIRLIGVMTAHIINLLAEELNMVDLSNVHFIGHSLGAHLGAYAGYALQRDFKMTLGRITGLDPAAPLFAKTSVPVRLDHSAAKFVDVIHTDANILIKGGLGIPQAIGHVDFYPNGGSNNPGCKLLQEYMKNDYKNVVENVQEFLGCNHIRSYQYFTESIKHTQCPFTAITCESYQHLKEGKCSRCGQNDHICIPIGYRSYESYKDLSYLGNDVVDTKKSLMLYSMTGETEPFCRAHYKITVRISGNDESTLHGGEVGTLFIKLHGVHKHTTEKIPLSSQPMFLEPGSEYTALVPGKYLRSPAHATISWEYKTNYLNPLTWRLIALPRMYIEYVLVESIELSDLYLKLCPSDQSAIITGSESVLQSSFCKN